MIVVSDRRITSTRLDGTVIRREDTDTKTVVLNRRYVMGFAGTGRFALDCKDGTRKTQRLEAWLMDNVPVGADDYFESLAARFGEAYEEYGIFRRHTFLAVGYASDGLRGATDAEIVVVANSAQYKHSFDVVRRPLGRAAFLIETSGVDLLSTEFAILRRALGRAVKRKPRQPYAVIPDFLSVMRLVAARDANVGPGVLVTTVPRTAVPVDIGQTVTVGGSYHPDFYLENEVSMFYPAGSEGLGSGVFQPGRISPEMMMGGFEMRVGALSLGPLEGMSPLPREQ